MPYDPITLKLVADEMAEAAGVELGYHCLSVGVVRDDSRICGEVFECKNWRWACLASTVIDATGDGVVATLAGASISTSLE